MVRATDSRHTARPRTIGMRARLAGTGDRTETMPGGPSVRPGRLHQTTPCFRQSGPTPVVPVGVADPGGHRGRQAATGLSSYQLAT
jgi:hypothetical protein